MSPRLIVPEAHWSGLRAHLLRDGDEHLAFLFARWEGERLLTQAVEPVPDEAVEVRRPMHGLTLRTEWLVRMLNVAVREKLTLIEAHNHPGAGAKIAFSPIDLAGQQEMAAYLVGNPVPLAYGALVLGDNAVAGQLWPAGSVEPVPLREVFVPGNVIGRWPADGHPLNQPPLADDRFDRQVRAFGREGQRQLEQATVAVIGLGGTGSIVAQELVHLGIGRLILIDHDTLEPSNLNRVVGASADAIGRPKVDVAAEFIRRTNPAVNIDALARSVTDPEALALSADADLIVGCVDSDGARLITTVLAQAYLVPYVDCGVGITAHDGEVVEAGGRVVTWVPGRPCLVCCRELDLVAAAEEFESPRQRAFRQAHGYVAGTRMRDPAVISLNGIVASLAVTELLALLTGVRPSTPYTFYDLLEQRVAQRVVKRDPRCPACALQGLAAAAGLDRYLRHGFPPDLPQLL